LRRDRDRAAAVEPFTDRRADDESPAKRAERLNRILGDVNYGNGVVDSFRYSVFGFVVVTFSRRHDEHEAILGLNTFVAVVIRRAVVIDRKRIRSRLMS
jgi:hypothetical protein